MTEPATPPAAPPAAPTPAPPPAAAAPDPGKQPPWGSPENFDAEKAWELIQNLRTEKADPALTAQVAALQKEQEESRQRLAAALGLTEAPKSEDLAETVKGLQSQFEAAQFEATRLRIAADHKIPAEYHDLLTETDTEKLKAQAEKVGALVAAHAAAAPPPAFQPNPGQGQGGQPLSDEAKAEAEYAKYYPTPNGK